MIGNSPCASSEGWIRTPSIEPENCRPEIPLMPVTLAESTRTKSSGWFCTSAHSTPMESIRTGMKAGHLNDAPVALPTERKIPKPL